MSPSFTKCRKLKTLRTSELGNGLRPFRDSVFGKLPGQDKPDRGLNLPRGNGWLLVVPSQTRRFLCKLLEDIVDEAVHDSHGFAWNTNVRVHLLQDLEDVNFVSLHALLRLLLILLSGTFLWDFLLSSWLLLRRRLLAGRLLLCLLCHSQMRKWVQKLINERMLFKFLVDWKQWRCVVYIGCVRIDGWTVGSLLLGVLTEWIC